MRGSFWVRVSDEVRAKGLGMAGLNERAGQWVAQVANLRVHGTHGEVVADRLAGERPLLGTCTSTLGTTVPSTACAG